MSELIQTDTNQAKKIHYKPIRSNKSVQSGAIRGDHDQKDKFLVKQRQIYQMRTDRSDRAETNEQIRSEWSGAE